MTNFERIKQMTVEELAHLINYITGCCRKEECYRCPLKDTSHHFQSCGKQDVEEWLNQEWEVEQ